MNSNEVGGFILQMEYIFLTAAYIADPHPTALHRTEFIKNKLEVELEHTIITEEEQWNQVNPSCLLAYLGIRGFANIEGPD